MVIKSILDRVGAYQQPKVEKDAPQDKKTGKSESSAGGTDRVNLSQEARLINETAKTARESQGVRVNKVEEIKNLIESGQYKPDNRKIAAKIVEEDLEIWLKGSKPTNGE